MTGRKRGRPPTKQSLDVDPAQDTSKKGNPSNMLYKKLDVRLLSELLYYFYDNVAIRNVSKKNKRLKQTEEDLVHKKILNNEPFIYDVPKNFFWLAVMWQQKGLSSAALHIMDIMPNEHYFLSCNAVFKNFLRSSSERGFPTMKGQCSFCVNVHKVVQICVQCTLLHKPNTKMIFVCNEHTSHHIKKGPQVWKTKPCGESVLDEDNL